jgi:hypothetical protein
MALGLLGLLQHKRLIAGMVLGVATLYIVGFFLAPSTAIQEIFRLSILAMPRPNDLYPPLYGIVFLMGSVLYLYRDKIPYHPAPAACLAIVWIYSISTHYLLPATILCIPYLVLTVGFMKLPLVDRVVTSRGCRSLSGRGRESPARRVPGGRRRSLDGFGS